MTLRWKTIIATLAATALVGGSVFAEGGWLRPKRMSQRVYRVNAGGELIPVADEVKIVEEKKEEKAEVIEEEKKEEEKKEEEKKEEEKKEENGNGNGEEKKEACPGEWLNSLLIGDCLSERTGLKIYGWLSGGASVNDGNFSGPGQEAATSAAGVARGANEPIRFNDREEFQMNQLYLVIERSVLAKDRIDFGARVDLLYGTDSRFTQALGLDDEIISNNQSFFYEMAIPQLYGDLFIPVAKGLTIRAGHYYTTMRYEVVPARDNFFYSHAYTMLHGEPFTHTGVHAFLKATDNLTLNGGFNRGWDTWADNNNGLSVMGGATYTWCEKNSLAFNAIYGPEQDEPRIATFSAPIPGPGFTGINDPGGERQRYFHSVVLQQQLTEKLKVVLQHDLGYQEGGSTLVAGEDAEWYGLVGYLFYDLNDKVSLGLRAEWFRDDDGSRVPNNLATSTANAAGLAQANTLRVANGLAPLAGAAIRPADNFYAFTLGANLKPTTYLKIRPELRWDFQDNNAPAAFRQPVYDFGTQSQQFTASIDFVLTF